MEVCITKKEMCDFNTFLVINIQFNPYVLYSTFIIIIRNYGNEFIIYWLQKQVCHLFHNHLSLDSNAIQFDHEHLFMLN